MTPHIWVAKKVSFAKETYFSSAKEKSVGVTLSHSDTTYVGVTLSQNNATHMSVILSQRAGTHISL